MVDTKDLKSFAVTGVRVRVPPSASYRGIAQLARALGLGPRGCWFESSFPDMTLVPKAVSAKGNLAQSYHK